MPFGIVDLRTSDDITTNALVLHGPWPGVTVLWPQSPEPITSTFDWARPTRCRGCPTEAARWFSITSISDSNNRWSNLARLQLLERLVYKEGRCVIIESPSIPVLALVRKRVGNSGRRRPERCGIARALEAGDDQLSTADAQDPNEEAFQSQFKLVHEGGTTTERLVQWVREGCDHTPYLRQLGRSLLAKVKSGEADSEALDALRQEGEARVHCYYQALWSTFTRNERLVLYQLGRDGWVIETMTRPFCDSGARASASQAHAPNHERELPGVREQGSRPERDRKWSAKGKRAPGAR